MSFSETERTPEAWLNLISALAIMSKHPANAHYPLSCEHDRLLVMADETKFTDQEIAALEKYGFSVNETDGGFYSFKFGSA